MKYAGQESSKLEFKENLPKSSQLIKTAIAFSNMNGGKLIVGINDRREVIGIPEMEAHEAMEWIEKSVFEATVPPILPLVYQQRIDGKVLLIMEVSAGFNKPYYQKSLGLDQGTFVRLGRSTMKANADLIEELKWQARGISYDQLPVYHATVEDLNQTTIEEFITHRRSGVKIRITEELLSSYHVVTKEHHNIHPSVAGLLLFGKNPQQFLTESYILCTHFSGVEGRNAIASRAMNGTLFEQFNAAYDFVLSCLNKSYHIKGKKRDEKLEIPAVAIREALMNAILHRNYHISAPIKLAIYQDRIEIFSPGGFPGPIDSDHLESGITYVRNHAIAKILWEFNYIEKMGSGFITIFSSYRKESLQSPLIQEDVNHIKVVLPRKKTVSGEGADEELILNLFHLAEEISRSDVVERLQIPKTTVGRLLNKMTGEGKLIRYGKGPKTSYKRGKAKD
ncbi:MAG: RNA-binding domain-containing protein [Parachlamydiaceae bacterium]